MDPMETYRSAAGLVGPLARHVASATPPDLPPWLLALWATLAVVFALLALSGRERETFPGGRMRA